jgi:hypothetical protein
MHRLVLDRQTAGTYALASMPFPPEEAAPGVTPDECLDAGRDNLLATPLPGGGRRALIEERVIEQDGVPGRQLILQEGAGKVSLSRNFYLNGTYRASVVIDAERKDDEEAWRFLRSVRFHR